MRRIETGFENSGGNGKRLTDQQEDCEKHCISHSACLDNLSAHTVIIVGLKSDLPFIFQYILYVVFSPSTCQQSHVLTQ